MSLPRWLAVLVGVECLICLFFIPRGLWSTILAVLFLVCFAAVGWTHGAFSPSGSRKAKP